MTDQNLKRPSIGLVAHDQKKQDLVEWASQHAHILRHFKIYATGTTGKHLMEATNLEIERFQSGPLGGDAQLGALIATGELVGLVFFIDPLSALPHDVDVKALTRLAIVYDVPLASSPSTAEAVVAYLNEKHLKS